MSDVIRKLVEEAIQGLVAEIASEGGILRAGPEAKRLAARFAGSGMSPREIMDAMLRAAAKAGIASEITDPD